MEIELKNKEASEFRTRLDQYKFKDLLVILFLFFFTVFTGTYAQYSISAKTFRDIPIPFTSS